MQDQINEVKEDLETCKVNVHSRMDIIDGKLDVLLSFHDNFKGFFTVMGWIGKLAVWATKVSVFLGAAWLVIKDHIK